MNRTNPPLEVFREHLSYDPHTGIFRWAKRSGSTNYEGKEVGSKDGLGYIRIRLRGNFALAHRLAWALVKGDWPPEQIDHINGNPSDNRIENLRAVSNRVNQINKKVHRNGMLPGARKNRESKRWNAVIYENGKYRTLGLFDTAEEASACYLARVNEIEARSALGGKHE